MQSDRTIQFWNNFYTRSAAVDDVSSVPTEGDPSNQDEDDNNCNGVENNDTATDRPTTTAAVQKEWILEPSSKLFDMILYYLPKLSTDDDNVCRILEIGCGNSRMAIELWKYMQQQQKNPSDSSSNDDSSCPPIPRRVQFWATDVSDICIQQIQERDAADIIIECNDNQQTTKNDDSVSINNNNINIDNSNEDEPFFRYSVLNVTELHPELVNQFDLILDKGCLDTFLFRSKNRGHGSAYAELIQVVLDNIQSWLKPCRSRLNNGDATRTSGNAVYSTLDGTLQDPPNNNITANSDRLQNVDTPCGGGEGHDDDAGIYLILSPRPKHKSIRDYLGFQSVVRYELDLLEIPRGDLEGGRSIDKSTNKILKKKQTVSDDDHIFMYVCRKNVNHNNNNAIKNSDNNDNRLIYDNSKLKSSAFSIKLDTIDPPIDTDICTKCNTCFLKFRHGECIASRGKRFWYRQWIGHCKHCKG